MTRPHLQLVFAANLNTGAGLTALKTVFGLDDIRWATASGGTLYIVGKGALIRWASPPCTSAPAPSSSSSTIAAAKKSGGSSNTGTIIGIIVVVLLIAGAGGYALSRRRGTSPS